LYLIAKLSFVYLIVQLQDSFPAHCPLFATESASHAKSFFITQCLLRR
jgi:hypothetical protein